MHDQTTPASDLGGDNTDYEEAVLRLVLNERPMIYRLCDLVREIALDPEVFAHRDGVEQAVRDLERVGLLHQQCECVLPTPAAVYVQGMDIG